MSRLSLCPVESWTLLRGTKPGRNIAELPDDRHDQEMTNSPTIDNVTVVLSSVPTTRCDSWRCLYSRINNTPTILFPLWGFCLPLPRKPSPTTPASDIPESLHPLIPDLSSPLKTWFCCNLTHYPTLNDHSIRDIQSGEPSNRILGRDGRTVSRLNRLVCCRPTVELLGI